jgi:hypothetical protein
MERSWKEGAVSPTRYYIIACLEGLRKAPKVFSQSCRWPGRDSNRAPLEYKSRALLLDKPVQSLLIFILPLFSSSSTFFFLSSPLLYQPFPFLFCYSPEIPTMITDCSNNRGISLLSAAYKIVSNILISTLSPYVDQLIADHQCGFPYWGSSVWVSLLGIISVGFIIGDHQCGFPY